MKKFKITFNSPVALSFVIICFVVTLLGVLTGGKSTEIAFMTYHSSLQNPMTYIRLFTHVLGHADFSTTMDIYTDVTKDLKKREFDDLGEKMKKQKGRKNKNDDTDEK